MEKTDSIESRESNEHKRKDGAEIREEKWEGSEQKRKNA